MQKILVIQTAFIGDVILATAVVEKLHAKWPEAEIDFLLRKGNESLFDGHPYLRRVIVRNKGEGKWKSLRKVLKVVRQEGYDLVVNLHRYLSSGLIAGFSKGGHVCGFAQNPIAWRFDHKVKHVVSESDPGLHEVERNQRLIADLTDEEPGKMRLYPSEADFEAVREGDPYVCVAPTSVWHTKQWPAERWTALIQAAPKELKVFLLGAPGDRKACESIAEATNRKNVVVKAGDLSLLQSAALMAGAQMTYVNDSAPMHLASSVDAPVTAVFLSTVPRFGFGPRSTISRVVETAEALDCRPCGLHGFKACPKGHFKCAEIDPLRVLGER